MLNPQSRRYLRLLNTRAHRLFACLLVVYLLLTAAYARAIPAFEAPDEYYHFAMIDHIHRTGWLPSDDGVYQQMRYHAPLYYLTSALLIAPLDTSSFPDAYPRNPHAQIGVGLATANRNYVAHGGGSPAAAAIYAVRAYSMALGALTLTGVYALGRALFGARHGTTYGLLAALIVMLNPQFLFVSSVITNDALVIALSTLALAVLITALRDGLTPRRLLLLAVLCALASIAKASGLALYPAVAAGALIAGWRQRIPLRRLTAFALTGAAAFALIAGWWYIGNFVAYGDFSAASLVAAKTGMRGAMSPATSEMGGLYLSFWGVFGWFNLTPPRAFYNWTVLLVAAALFGAGWRVIFRRGPASFAERLTIASGTLLLGLHAVAVIAAWVQFNQLVMAAQGRLWFPLIGAVGLALAWGLRGLPRAITAVLLGGLGVAAVAMPLLVIAPAYAPQAVTAWTPPADAVEMRFEEPGTGVTCVSAWLSPVVWDGDHVGDGVIEVPLHWQSTCAMQGYWSVFVHLIDVSLEICEPPDSAARLAQADTMPQDGRLTFPAMTPGAVYADTLRLPVPDALDRSRTLALNIGLYDAKTGIRPVIRSATLSGPVRLRSCAGHIIEAALMQTDPTR